MSNPYWLKIETVNIEIICHLNANFVAQLNKLKI